MSGKGLARLAVAATLLGLFVVVLGAYVRLSDAGLGCPDWPGCYGQLIVPDDAQAVARANAAFPDRPVEAHKGWKEMVHRYFAGALGLLIAALAAVALRRRRRPGQQVVLPVALVGIVIFQALLGMWTVTLQLKPVVVMGHLLGGFATVGLLWWVALRAGSWFRADPAGITRGMRTAAALALLVLIVQVALGGWTSANYAALACTDFPTCHGQWWPRADFGEGFLLWRGLGINYEYGVLENPARVAIQLVHRIGAVVTFLLVFGLAMSLLLRSDQPAVRWVAGAVAALVTTQVALGISNVVFSLPLPVAAAHNGVAALLLLALITLNHTLRAAPPKLGRG